MTREAVNKRFGQNLRRIREGRDLSQEALADVAEIHRTEASLLERGGRQPAMGTLVKLAAALEVPLGNLLEGIEWRSPERPAEGGFHIWPESNRGTRKGLPR